MKVKIESGNAPKAIGPYSQAVLVDDTLYVSGNIPVNPSTGGISSRPIPQEVAWKSANFPKTFWSRSSASQRNNNDKQKTTVF